MSFVDPSSRNKLFNADTIYDYLLEYKKELSNALEKVSASDLNKVFDLLQDARRYNKRIWVAGNGGSAAIADHLCCDFTKGTRFTSKKSLKTNSLSSNSATLTAIANDFGYDQIFLQQLEMLSNKDDIVILISSSGNSENVIRAAEWANDNGLTTISLTGFSGGKLSKITKINLHIPVNNYGIVEDAHQILMHSLAQFISKVNQFSLS
jgi:phosphoheptose isomerase